MRALKQLLLGPVLFLKIRWTKYVFYSVLTFLVAPVLSVLDLYFRGAFVGTVEYLGKIVPYFIFLLIGYVFSRLSASIFENTYFIFVQERPIIVFKADHPLLVPVSMSLITFVNTLINLVPVSIILAFLNKNPLFLFETAFLAYLFGFPLVFGLGILFASLALVIRGRDFRAIVNLFNRALWILFPVAFSVEVFPPHLQQVVLFTPTVSLVEGVRRLIFGIDGTILLLYAFLSGLLVSAFSLFIFERAFNYSRKTGKILVR